MRRILPLLIAAALTGGAAPKSGSISGRVVDAAGTPVTGAKVSLDSGEPKTTGSTGRFAFPNLAAGHYDIRVEAESFEPVRQRFVVNANTDTAIEIRLHPRRRR